MPLTALQSVPMPVTSMLLPPALAPLRLSPPGAPFALQQLTPQMMAALPVLPPLLLVPPTTTASAQRGPSSSS